MPDNEDKDKVRQQIEGAFSEALDNDMELAVENANEAIRERLERAAANKGDSLKSEAKFLFQFLFSMGYFATGDYGQLRRRRDLNRFFRRVLVDEGDYGVGTKAGKYAPHIYEALLATMAGRSVSDFSISAAVEKSETSPLLWCAFAKGDYATSVRNGWIGIDPKTAGVAKFWIYETRKQKESDDDRINADTTYDAYVDHVYERLGRLAEPIDLVLADLIMLIDLDERRLITAIGPDRELARFYKRGSRIGRAGDLGRLATVNYHVPARAPTASLIISAPTGTEPAEQGGDDLLKKLVETGDAAAIFKFSPQRTKGGDRQADKGNFQHALDFPKTWRDEVQESLRNLPSGSLGLTPAEFAHRWLGVPRDPNVQLKSTRDPFLLGLGTKHPIAPVQFAAGAHATYSTFAYFANCAPLVAGLVEKADVDQDQGGEFVEPSTGKPLDARNECVLRRGGEYLRMPPRRQLQDRAEMFFGFIWNFAPALSLCLDHVAAARARTQLLKDRWFDPCLPVEAVLFHADNWLRAMQIGASPAWVGQKIVRLSCFGGYALAVSSEAIWPRDAQTMAGQLVERLAQTDPNSPYHRIIPSAVDPNLINDSSVRPPVSFWPSMDAVISETVRLYMAALVVLRCLKLDASLVATTVVGSTSQQQYDAFATAVKTLSSGFASDLNHRDKNAEISAADLFGEWRRHVTVGAVTRIFDELQKRAKPLCQGKPALEAIINSSISSLKTDADYIVGIVSTCETIKDLSSYFVDTIISKLTQVAASKNWLLVQLKD